MPPMFAVLVASTITMAAGNVYGIAFPAVGREAGLGDSTVSLLAAVPPIVTIFCSPWWGRKLSSFGISRMMVLGTAATALGTAALLVWLWLERVSVVQGLAFLAVLVLIRILHAAVSCAFAPASFTFVTMASEPAVRSRAMARYTATISLGILLAAALVAGLSRFDLLLPFLVATLLTVLAVVALAFADKVDVQAARTSVAARLRWLDRRYTHWIFALAAASCALNVVQLVIPFQLMDRMGMSANDAAGYSGTLFVIFCALGLLIRSFVLPAIRVSSEVIVVTALAFMALAIAAMPLCTSVEQLFAPFVVYGSGAAFVIPAIYSVSSLSVSADERGDFSGLIGATPSIGAIVGAFGAGALYELWPWLPFVLLAGLLAVAAIFVTVSNVRVAASG